MTQTEASIQARVAAFLSRPDAYPFAVDRVERIETHGALIFLAGPEVYKVKRQVKFSYMDFSTVDLRRRACEREIAINKPHAPDIYVDVVPITAEPNGQLALGGNGTPVEWAVRMRRFHQHDLLGTRVKAAPLDLGLCRDLADAAFQFHETATVVRRHNTRAQMLAILSDVVTALAATAAFGDSEVLAQFERGCMIEAERARPVLARRADGGFVRRCHGDLHLGNVVIWNGAPVLFDAIEFDEGLATVDTLYDLAFLLMDLEHHKQRAGANAVLNRYLWRSKRTLDLEGLAALPLFLSLRAGVRAMVTAHWVVQSQGNAQAQALARARAYLDSASGYLVPQHPRLVAIGGLSGTGKSTLGTMLAPSVGKAPGAVHLRSDLERKAMYTMCDTERLPPSAYTPAETAKVYALVAGKAESILRSGHSVIVDAVFSSQEERCQIERVAEQLKVGFSGLWLEAPADTLMSRVGARRGDASDATPDVVARQLSYETGAIGWTKIPAGGDREATYMAGLDELQEART